MDGWGYQKTGQRKGTKLTDSRGKNMCSKYNGFCSIIFQAEAVFDMIGYPDWIEEPAKLDKYYENVSRHVL